MTLSLEYKASFAEDKSAPVIFLVHGRAGTKEVMWTFKRVLPEGVTVISPQAPRPDPIGGFSWWDVLNYDDITEQMIDEGVSILSNFIDGALREFGLTPKKILAFGFSQGSGALSLLLQRDPKRFTGVGLLAGFVIKDWLPLPKESLSPVFIAHGSVDKTVPLTRALDGKSYLESHGATVTMVTDEVGHKVGAEGMRQLKNWTKELLEIREPQ